MPQTFQDNSTHPSRGLQAYLILIGRAAQQQTIQYRQLGDMMHYGVGPILAQPLGKIMHWCEHEGLPALTVIVVEKETGLPSTGPTTVQQGGFSAKQQRVFAFDWYSILPPTRQDLA